MNFGGIVFLRCCLFLGRFDERWSRFWLAGFRGFDLWWTLSGQSRSFYKILAVFGELFFRPIHL
jgi:hypothetical protein